MDYTPHGLNLSLQADPGTVGGWQGVQGLNDTLPAQPRPPASAAPPWQRIADVSLLLHPHWLEFAPLPYAFHLAVGLAITVTAVVSLVGNVLVLWSIARFRSLRTSSNMFLISLALADVLMDCLSLPLFAAASFVGHWPFGYYGCQFYGVTTAIAGLVTINTLAAISYDRYTVVVRHLSPLQHHFSAVNAAVILVIWMVSGLWALAPLLGWGHYVLEGMGTTCTYDYLRRDAKNASFVVVLMVFNFGGPLVLIVFSYSRIFMSVSSVQRGLMDCSPRIAVGTQRQAFGRKTELRTATTILAIVCFFCVAWTPYVIVSLVGLFGDVSVVTPLVSAVPCILAKVATVSNPPLYSVGHPKFRNKIRCLLSRSLTRSSFTLAATSGLQTVGQRQSSSV